MTSFTYGLRIPFSIYLRKKSLYFVASAVVYRRNLFIEGETSTGRYTRIVRRSTSIIDLTSRYLLKRLFPSYLYRNRIRPRNVPTRIFQNRNLRAHHNHNFLQSALPCRTWRQNRSGSSAPLIRSLNGHKSHQNSAIMVDNKDSASTAMAARSRRKVAAFDLAVGFSLLGTFLPVRSRPQSESESVSHLRNAIVVRARGSHDR